MMKRFACVAFVAVFGAACSSGGGSQPAATAQDSAAPALAAAPGAGAQPSGGAAATTQPGRSPAPAATRSTPTPSAPAEPPKPKFHEMTIPSGTTLSLTLETAVASDTSKAEDAVRAKLAKPIVIDGTTVAPEGAEVVGSVLETNQAGRVKGRASVAFRFDRLTAWNETYDIRTARIAREAEATKGEDAKKVGIGAGVGGVIGAIAGGKKGAAIGGAVGAGAGTGVVLATRGDEVRLAPGTTVSTKVEQPVTIFVPIE